MTVPTGIAFSGKAGEVWVLEVESKKQTEVANDRAGQVRDYVWSPHGGHLAFSVQVRNRTDPVNPFQGGDGGAAQFLVLGIGETEDLFIPLGKGAALEDP